MGTYISFQLLLENREAQVLDPIKSTALEMLDRKPQVFLADHFGILLLLLTSFEQKKIPLKGKTYQVKYRSYTNVPNNLKVILVSCIGKQIHIILFETGMK